MIELFTTLLKLIEPPDIHNSVKILYAFFWVIPWRLNFMCWCFGTLCLQVECSETSAYKIQTPENYPEESTQHSEHDESLKSRLLHLYGEESVKICLFLMGVGGDPCYVPCLFCELQCTLPTICCVFCVYLRVTRKKCGSLAVFVIRGLEL